MTIAPPETTLITCTIDGVEVKVPKGTLVIRAAEELGIDVPRFCDHPLLDPVGACRQCIVEIEGQRKPMTACTTTVAEGMVINTQRTSSVAANAQAGTMELLLINHPLDCPVCDKGGECPLQNQAMSAGRSDTRFHDVKRTYPKPLPISTQVLLDRERCVLCARCTRFSEQIAGDPFIDLFERGSAEQVSVYEDEPFNSYFSGNTIQICPVGALTSATYRFRARPFDLVSTPSVCEHCSSGCAQRTDWRRGRVMRRLSGDDPEVNEEWNCDKGRFAFTYATAPGRLTTPLIRDEEGVLRPASWSDALNVAAEGLREARDAGGIGVLTGGRLTFEDAYAYSVFSRKALSTNDIDFRARPHSAEEATFLASHVAGRTPVNGLTYKALEAAPVVLCAGFEPEEESPIVFLRLRKKTRDGAMRVLSIAPFATRGLEKLKGTLIEAAPGAEPAVFDAMAAPREGSSVASWAQALREPGAVILVGERLASIPGALSAATRCAAATGANLAWIPRRAGERGSILAGLLPGLLPGEISVGDSTLRNAVENAWEMEAGSLPSEPGKDGNAMVRAASAGSLSALLVAGVDPADTSDPAAFERALDTCGFVISLEIRESPVTKHADVVFPVAPPVEKAGSYYTWEGRARPFDQVLAQTGALTDAHVLTALAEEMDVDLGFRSVDSIRTQWQALLRAIEPLSPLPFPDPEVVGGSRKNPNKGEAVLSTWHHLLDAGTLQMGEENLAGTARPSVVRLSADTAAEIGVKNGEKLAVSTDRGTIVLPLEITQMPARVVWLPTNSPDSAVYSALGVDAGEVVRIGPGINSPERKQEVA